MAKVFTRSDSPYWFARFTNRYGVSYKQSTKVMDNGTKRAEQEALEVAINLESKERKLKDNALDFSDLLQAIDGLQASQKDMLAIALADHMPKSAQSVTLSITIEEVRKEWLEVMGNKKSDRWLTDERLYVNRFLKFIGSNKPIGSVTVKDINRYISEAERDDKAPWTIINYLKKVTQLFDYAFSVDYVTKNVCKFAKKPTAKTTNEFVYIPDDVLDDVISTATNIKDQIFWTFLRYTALNPKDVSFLKPDQIEKDDVGTGYHINGERAKNGRLQRIPIHPKLQAYLDNHHNDCFDLFPHPSARQRSNRRFQAGLRKHNVNSTLGKLRHTCLTNLLNAGMSLDEVSIIAGHIDTKMLKKVYILHTDQIKAAEGIRRLK